MGFVGRVKSILCRRVGTGIHRGLKNHGPKGIKGSTPFGGTL